MDSGDCDVELLRTPQATRTQGTLSGGRKHFRGGASCYVCSPGRQSVVLSAGSNGVAQLDLSARPDLVDRRNLGFERHGSCSAGHEHCNSERKSGSESAH